MKANAALDVGNEGLPRDTSERIYEVGLVRQVDRVRAVLAFFLLALVLAAPEGMLTEAGASASAVALAALFTVFTLFGVDWESLWEKQRLPMVAATVLLADVAWLSLFVYGTGGFASPFKGLLLLPVLFAAAFFSGLPAALPLVATIVLVVQGSFAAGSSWRPGLPWDASGQMIAVIAAAWLAYGLSRVAERERSANDSVLRNLSEGAMLVDADHTIVFANARIEKICGIPSDMIVGRSIDDIPREPAYEGLLQLLDGVDTAAREGTPITRDVTPQGPADTKLRVTIIPLGPDPHGAFGWVVLSQDMVAGEQAVNRADREGIVGGSRELRRPLTTLRAVSQVISRLIDDLGSQEKEQLRCAIDREAGHLLDFASKLMDLAALRKGTYELSKGAVQVNNLIDSVTRVFKPRARLHNLKFESDCDADLPEISGDVNRLEQLLSHLCEGAINWADEGGHLHLEAARVDGHIQISLSHPEWSPLAGNIQAALEGCRQMSPEGDAAFPDGGMGLYLARRIARLHKGDITVASNGGERCALRVMLPIGHAVQSSTKSAFSRGIPQPLQ